MSSRGVLDQSVPSSPDADRVYTTLTNRGLTKNGERAPRAADPSLGISIPGKAGSSRIKGQRAEPPHLHVPVTMPWEVALPQSAEGGGRRACPRIISPDLRALGFAFPTLPPCMHAALPCPALHPTTRYTPLATDHGGVGALDHGGVGGDRSRLLFSYVSQHATSIAVTS